MHPEEIFGATQRREKIFSGLLGRSGGMLPQKNLKRSCSGLAEIAFLDLDISSLY